MKKQYQTTNVEIQVVGSVLMIPAGSPPKPHLAPERHWVPGPGASYDPKGNII